MMDFFTRAAKSDPQHYILIRNVNAARAWFKEHGPERGLPLELEARHDFQLLERTVQPTLPGPLSPTFAEWHGAEEKIDAPAYVKTPELEGSKHELLQRRRLAVVGNGS
jgi:anaerobic magnesium-protoporphyrin IX monomethyl ester cyclase